MDFQPITLGDKELFNQHLTSRFCENILFNFTSLFIWRDWDPYTWCMAGDAICIHSGFYGMDVVFPPFAISEEAILNATELLIADYQRRQVPFTMIEVTSSYLEVYQKHWPGRFTVEPYRDGANYIYHTTDLALLKGRKYNPKRNHVHRFQRDYPSYRFVPLTSQWIAGCRQLLEKWYAGKNNPSLDMERERQGVHLALDHFGDLDYLGACLMVGNRVVAFTLGEPLNEDTVAIHIEKADPEYNGAFTAINQFFVRDYWQDYPFINRAEDMGEPGMRAAKLSYHPCKMIEKFHLRLVQPS